MGKLHKLRKAIEREPEKWFRQYYPDGRRYPAGTWFFDRKTIPKPDYGARFHRNYVRKILFQLGYDVS